MLFNPGAVGSALIILIGAILVGIGQRFGEDMYTFFKKRAAASSKTARMALLKSRTTTTVPDTILASLVDALHSDDFTQVASILESLPNDVRFLVQTALTDSVQRVRSDVSKIDEPINQNILRIRPKPTEIHISLPFGVGGISLPGQRAIFPFTTVFTIGGLGIILLGVIFLLHTLHVV
jgi:hypothetical protein